MVVCGITAAMAQNGGNPRRSEVFEFHNGRLINRYRLPDRGRDYDRNQARGYDRRYGRGYREGYGWRRGDRGRGEYGEGW
jgi:hypothetical protein